MLWLSIALAAPPCGTPALLAGRPRPAVTLPTPPPGDLQPRDPYQLPQVVETEHFAIRWHEDTGFDGADVVALAEAFETAWAAEVDDFGMPAPIGSDAWLFNVYIGDTGGNAPSAYGYSGYFTYDDDGLPLIVINAERLADRDYAAAIAAHELFHALQDATGSYSYADTAAWIWEATAMWAEGVVYPQQAYTAQFLWGYAFLPELPVNHFLYPTGTGSPEEVYQYGAFIFARHLSEHVADDALIARWWTEPTSADPLDALAPLLAELGTDLDAVFFEHALHAATWDYAQGDAYADALEEHGGWDSPQSHRPTDVVLGATSAWKQPADHAPHSYGANYWRLQDVAERFEVEFEGAPGPRWQVGVATRTGDEHLRWAATGETATLTVELDGTPSEAWLVVAAADTPVDDGSYDYRFRLHDLGPAEEPDTGEPADDEEPARACGCGSTGASAWSAWSAWTALSRR